jgi:hypothetical protein
MLFKLSFFMNSKFAEISLILTPYILLPDAAVLPARDGKFRI